MTTTKEATPELQAFREMVEKHDLTYSYSDDSRVWNRGREQQATIQAAAKKLPRKEAVRIWNSVVDKKLTGPAREGFYW